MLTDLIRDQITGKEEFDGYIDLHSMGHSVQEIGRCDFSWTKWWILVNDLVNELEKDRDKSQMKNSDSEYGVDTSAYCKESVRLSTPIPWKRSQDLTHC